MGNAERRTAMRAYNQALVDSPEALTDQAWTDTMGPDPSAPIAEWELDEFFSRTDEEV
ncbi:MAG: hypothetical protein ABI354_00060 [Candidatus Saccharimonadales bacterium]